MAIAVNVSRYSLSTTTKSTVIGLVESRAGIIQRPSLLDPSIKLSPYSAPDSIRQCLCSCGHNRGMTHVELPDCYFSSFGDFHLCGAG